MAVERAKHCGRGGPFIHTPGSQTAAPSDKKPLGPLSRYKSLTPGIEGKRAQLSGLFFSWKQRHHQQQMNYNNDNDDDDKHTNNNTTASGTSFPTAQRRTDTTTTTMAME